MTDITQDLAFVLKNAIHYINELERKVNELQRTPASKLLTIDDIATLCGVNRRTVADAWIHRPDFPAPVIAPSRRSRRWDRDEIIAWAMPSGRKSARRSLGSTLTAAGSSPDAR